MTKYNPKWFYYLMPFYDGFNKFLPDADNPNLELNLGDLDIDAYSKCIVGEAHNFSAKYWFKDSYCEECNKYGNAFSTLYLKSTYHKMTSKRYSEILQEFNNNLALFYAHMDAKHQ